MNIDSRLVISPEAVAREVGGETMLLDLASGTYFGLDEVGGRVWQALEDGATLAEACDGIEADFDVSREQLESDVLKLANELLEKSLVSVS